MHKKRDRIITKILRRNIQQKQGRKFLPNNNNKKNKSHGDDDALSKEHAPSNACGIKVQS